MIDLILVDYATGKNAFDEKLKVNDKAFKEKDSIYLDLEKYKPDESIFKETIKIFEEFLGKDFWKDVA